MTVPGDNQVAMIAGATGLVGTELIKLLLEETAISQVYALTRGDLPFFHSKLEVIQNKTLVIEEWGEENLAPEIGFICLGSTIKQAGSKQALAAVDYQLVCNVAQEMKLIGVKRLAIVSSFGASHRSPSHYLRCKGKMENTIKEMGFEHVTFVRPGPLKGLRDKPRTDEAVIHLVLKVLKPFMIGHLANLIPIDAHDVAKTMLYSVFTHAPGRFSALNSREMLKFIHSDA